MVDAATGDLLYQRNADVPATPASTTKLLTAAAVPRGARARLSAEHHGGGGCSNRARWCSSGGGDATLAVGAKGAVCGRGPAGSAGSAGQEGARRHAADEGVVDTSLFRGPEAAKGWSPEDISPFGQVAPVQALMTNGGRIEPVTTSTGGIRGSVIRRFRRGRPSRRCWACRRPRSGGERRSPLPAVASAPAAGVAPGARLGVLQSPPLVQVIDWMLEQSDNAIAEVLGRQVAVAAASRRASTAAPRRLSRSWARSGSGDEAQLYDASGLSRRNGISPALLTELLTLAAGGNSRR